MSDVRTAAIQKIRNDDDCVPQQLKHHHNHNHHHQQYRHPQQGQPHDAAPPLSNRSSPGFIDLGSPWLFGADAKTRRTVIPADGLSFSPPFDASWIDVNCCDVDSPTFEREKSSSCGSDAGSGVLVPYVFHHHEHHHQPLAVSSLEQLDLPAAAIRPRASDAAEPFDDSDTNSDADEKCAVVEQELRASVAALLASHAAGSPGDPVGREHKLRRRRTHRRGCSPARPESGSIFFARSLDSPPHSAACEPASARVSAASAPTEIALSESPGASGVSSGYASSAEGSSAERRFTPCALGTPDAAEAEEDFGSRHLVTQSVASLVIVKSVDDVIPVKEIGVGWSEETATGASKVERAVIAPEPREETGQEAAMATRAIVQILEPEQPSAATPIPAPVADARGAGESDERLLKPVPRVASPKATPAEGSRAEQQQQPRRAPHHSRVAAFQTPQARRSLAHNSIILRSLFQFQQQRAAGRPGRGLRRRHAFDFRQRHHRSSDRGSDGAAAEGAGRALFVLASNSLPASPAYSPPSLPVKTMSCPTTPPPTPRSRFATAAPGASRLQPPGPRPRSPGASVRKPAPEGGGPLISRCFVFPARTPSEKSAAERPDEKIPELTAEEPASESPGRGFADWIRRKWTQANLAVKVVSALAVSVAILGLGLKIGGRQLRDVVPLVFS